MPGLVSVVMSCYNYGHYLPYALQSVMDQTYTNLEIIVVNDGSTDNTDQVMQPFLSNPKVRYIKQKNRGQANAKNTGIKNASGKYVAFLDADDLWDREKLEKQLKLFSDMNTGVVFSGLKFINQSGQLIDYKLIGKYFVPHRGNVTQYLIFDNFIPFSSSVVLKDLLDRHGIFNEKLKMTIDWDLWLRLSLHCHFDFIKEPLLIYRLGHCGQMSKNTVERFFYSDRVFISFISAHPEALSKKIVRKAKIYRLLNRAGFYRNRNLLLSNKYYFKVLKSQFINLKAYKGLIKNFIIDPFFYLKTDKN